MLSPYLRQRIMESRRAPREYDERGYDMRYDRARYDMGYDGARGGNRGGNMRNMGGSDKGYESDGRQGVKGTGPYGIGGRMYYGRDRGGDYGRNDYGRGDYGRGDYNRGGDYGSMPFAVQGDILYDDKYNRGYDYAYDRGNDYGGEMRLTEAEMKEWKEKLENADGTKGAHFTMDKIAEATRAIPLKIEGEYSMEDLCMTANMLYSDFGEVFKPVIPKEKEHIYYTKAAKAFLEDKDAATRGAEKLMTYFCTIVCGGE